MEQRIMKMRKKVIQQLMRWNVVALLLLLVSTAAYAVPAKPGVRRQLKLDDGTTVSATLVGDEHGHYWLGTNGKTYLTVDRDDKAMEVNLEGIKEQAQERRLAVDQRRARRLAAAKKVGTVGEYIGEKKGLILLVNFSDVSFKNANDNALYQRIANEENFSEGQFHGSVYDYFYAQSEGQFKLTFDVVGPYTVSKNQSYYGSNNARGDDKYPATMVIEALKQADEEVNFADYDWDDDGEVDQVFVIYAGKGEADGGPSYTIWPHEYSLSYAQYFGDGEGAQFLDGMTIDTYACGSELNGAGNLEGIGTICHEFSHCLGYPDFYDTDYSGGQGMGNWDLMDGGCYNGDGFVPSGFTSWERWVAGWKKPIELENTKNIENMKSLMDGGECYIVYNKGHRNEYFLLENRRLVNWDAALPGSGLLILHVDYNEMAWESNQPNDVPSRQRMTWIPADNNYQYTMYMGTKYYSFEGMANDPFPYGAVNAFNKSTTPAAKFYNKNIDGSYYLDSSIENITRNGDGTVSFFFRGLTNVSTPTFSHESGHYEEPFAVTISCETEGAKIHYTLDGSKPTKSSAIYTEPILVKGNTTLKAVAYEGDDESKIATACYIFDSNLMTFKRVENVDEIISGMRYVIACDSKLKAAGKLDNKRLVSEDVAIKGDVVTINDSISVFTLVGSGDSYSLRNAEGQYLYAVKAKELAYSDEEKMWTLEDGDGGVTIGCTYGKMFYNVTSPRFNVYTLNYTSSSMIAANLYMEYYVGPGPVLPDPVIYAEDSLNIYALVGDTRTKSISVVSEHLTEDITVTLADDNHVFSLDAATIAKAESEGEGMLLNVTFNPVKAGIYHGTITLTSAGADTVAVALCGSALGKGGYVVPSEEDGHVYPLDKSVTMFDASELMNAYGGELMKDENGRVWRVRENADGTLTLIIGARMMTLEKNVVYNLNGQRVDKPKSGVYIVNGRKVVLK